MPTIPQPRKPAHLSRVVSMILLARCLRTPVLSALLIVATVSACKKADADDADSTSGAPAAADAPASRSDSLSLPVVAAEARNGDLVLRVNTTGIVRSEALVKLTAEVGGVIVLLPARSGSVVRKGDIILKLDPYPFDFAVRDAQSRMDQAQQKVFEAYGPDSISTGKGPSPAQRRAYEMREGVPAAALALEKARQEQLRSTVLSPIDGVLDAVLVTNGERINTSQAVATVVDPHNLRVDAQVFEHDLAVLRPGSEAFITSAGAPGRELRGRVEAIMPLLDSATHAGRAIVRFAGDGRLRPGMYAEVQLESMRLTNRRLVPTRAVIERDGRPLVFVVREGRAQWVYIEAGRSNGIETEVLPDTVTGVIPVNAGDKVIVDGHLTLTHDASVTITAIRDKGVIKAAPLGQNPARKPQP